MQRPEFSDSPNFVASQNLVACFRYQEEVGPGLDVFCCVDDERVIGAAGIFSTKLAM